MLSMTWQAVLNRWDIIYFNLGCSNGSWQYEWGVHKQIKWGIQIGASGLLS
jgi:hypothetical protein